MPETALVTGASSGIGRELSRVLAVRGHDLVLVARSRDRLEALAAELRERRGVRATVIPMDLGHPDGARELFQETSGRGLRIDILVNNAGIGLYGRFIEIGLEEELAQIRLDVTAPSVLCKLFGREMVRRNQGRILNVSSTAAYQAGPLMAGYYAAKAYLLSLSEALHRELRHQGVTVTALCPGKTRTDFFRRAGMKESLLAGRFLMMDPVRVAEAGYRGLMRGKPVVIPGRLNRISSALAQLAPRRWTAAAAEAFNRER